MNAAPVTARVLQSASIPGRRAVLRLLLAAGASLGLPFSLDAAEARKRRKTRRRKTVAPTCARSCPAGCSTCYQRPAGPVLCGGVGSADCAVTCNSDNDCLETFRPYCTRSFTDRATGETASWGCPGNQDGVCTSIAVCEA